MATIELSIDLGSKFITIFQRGAGIVLREPALAIVEKVRNRTELRDVGYRASNIGTSSMGAARLIAPIKEGVVVDVDMAAKLLGSFLAKIIPQKLFKPTIKAFVSICCSSSGSERQAVEKCCLKAGIKEVTLVEAPLSLLAYTNSVGGLFVDIGGGRTEIAAVTNHGIATGCSVNIAGDAFNDAIIKNFEKRYGVILGEYTVENLKKTALSFYANDQSTYAVSGGGRDGNPRSLFVSAGEMREAVLPLVESIIEVIESVLKQTPPDLSAEILRKGVFLSGGSLHIPGFAEYLEQCLELPVTVLKDMEGAVAIGGGQFFENKDLLSDMLGVKLQ